MADNAEVSFVVSTIGLVLSFVLVDPGASADASPVPISNALSATVTWVGQDGRNRPLTLATPASAVFTYTVSAGDYRSPRRELGRLLVSFGGQAFWTSAFVVAVHPRF